jgi:hypothetical protein
MAILPWPTACSKGRAVREPCDIGDLDHALNHLKVDGYYMFSGAIIAPLGSVNRHEQLPEC